MVGGAAAHPAATAEPDVTVAQTRPITLFYRQVGLHRGLPFSVRIPNETTRKALEEARTRRNLASFDSVDDLFEDLV
jgi:DNA-damage-inducible protein J